MRQVTQRRHAERAGTGHADPAAPPGPRRGAPRDRAAGCPPRARPARVRGGTGRAASPRSGPRPVAPTGRPPHAPGAAAGAAKRTAAPRPRRLTGRATVLIAVLVALAAGVHVSGAGLPGQQSEIARLEAAQTAQREHDRRR